MEFEDFEGMFGIATDGKKPFPYQTRLAESDSLPQLIRVPTGAGKTAAVVLAWLWRRRFGAETVRNSTPRRLVYCLPMRVLVEQTRDNAILWLHRLGLLGGIAEIDSRDGEKFVKAYAPSWDDPKKIVVMVLMGGEDADKWDLYPERDAILIGTQDMLLSRALNRGYGMSRYRWPMHFGLLNNDCLWVMDEVQLMGNGLTTTAQLEGFRRTYGTMLESRSIWLSATLRAEWLITPDHDTVLGQAETLRLDERDLEQPDLRKRLNSRKKLQMADFDFADEKEFANQILKTHEDGTRTIAILNTVKRAVKLYQALKAKASKAELILLHSQFRPPDKKALIDRALSEKDAIIISTQVVEAGVDFSAKTLFTELAPWSSMVQRFGRCNRYGEHENASISWIDVPEEHASPYDAVDLKMAAKKLAQLAGKDVSPNSLPEVEDEGRSRFVIRQKDMMELFDTTTDLTGHDIDISRYIRDNENTDVQVFWREIQKGGPSAEEPAPRREELCPVHMKDIRELTSKGGEFEAWFWDHMEGRWDAIRRPNMSTIYPGQMLMLRASSGRYDSREGWNPKEKSHVPVIGLAANNRPEEYGRDSILNDSVWMTIRDHTDRVVGKATEIAETIGLPERFESALAEGARWHDSGKAHPSFQAMLVPEQTGTGMTRQVAKAPKNAWKTDRLPTERNERDERRKYFRHELASGLLALLNSKEDIICYLAAAHHGKVRLSIRSMPDEYRPESETIRFARGVWDGDLVPETDLGGGIEVPPTVINLASMELGETVSGRSWLARMIELRDSTSIGIFRLGYLESLLKAADERASGGL